MTGRPRCGKAHQRRRDGVDDDDDDEGSDGRRVEVGEVNSWILMKTGENVHVIVCFC